MRRALLTLSSAGIIGSLFFSSCTIEKDSDDDDDNGGSNGINTSRGGNGIITTSSGGSGATSNGGSGNETQFEQEACPDLLTTLKQGDTTQVCSTSKKAAKFEKINMLIVLDKSGSMKDQPAGYTKTKWESAKDSLNKALNPSDTLVSYGFMLYPYVEGAAAAGCDLPMGDAAINIGVQSADVSVPAIIQKIGENQPGGGTPTAAALTAAYNYYTTGAGAGLQGTKYVLLVTDGGPNCNVEASCGPDTCTANMDKSGSCGTGIANCCDPALTVPAGSPPANSLCLDDGSVTTQLTALIGQGIKTFVVGIPGSEAYANYLDGFADAGGVPVADKPHKYYEVKSETDLVEAFTKITTSLVRECEVPLQEEPQDTTKINVAVDCNAVPRTMADGTVNWEYNVANRSIDIKGKQCEVIQSSGVKRIDVVNGCPTVIQL